MNALEFVGAEVHVGVNGANNAMVVDEGWSGAGPITSWVSHPSAIGYRLQGVVSAGSGSGGGGGGSGSGSGGGGTITIAAVSPDFDSGMNDGTDGQELERVANFYTGTEENPTSAQSAPTPRAEQEISNGVPPGNPIAVPTSTKGSSDGEDPPPSNLPPVQGPGTDPGDQPPPPTTVPGGPAPVSGPGGRPTPSQQAGPAFNPWNPWTYGPTLAQLGRDAVNVAGNLLTNAKREAQLLPGTMGALPGALGSTLQSGQAIDSLQGMAKKSKLLGVLSTGTTMLLPDAPVCGNQGDFDQGANTLAPLADEAAVQLTVGKAARALGCLAKGSGPLARVLAPALKTARLGLGANAAVGALKGLNEGLNNGDSVAVAKNLIALGGAVYAIFGGGCFAAGTPILTPDGSKLIETIQPGDWVLAAPDDDPYGEPVPRQVEEIFENYLPTLDLHVNGRIIRTTAEHPFWVRGRGWVDANRLEAGEELRAHDGRWPKVERIEGPMPAVPVYNVCVEEYHTYFVGHQVWGFAVWAHNACSRTSGENVHAANGRLAHQKYNPGPNYDTGAVLGNGLRPDAVDLTNRIVRELKPNNPRAIQKGGNQLGRYLLQLHKQYGGDWIGYIDTY